MTYCNRDASIALKEIGYDEQCICYFDQDGDSIVGEYFNGAAFSLFPNCIARPNHLQAADWLFSRGIELIFRPNQTTVFYWYGELPGGREFTEADNDHRNAAIVAACGIVKERKESGNM